MTSIEPDRVGKQPSLPCFAFTSNTPPRPLTASYNGHTPLATAQVHQPPHPFSLRLLKTLKHSRNKPRRLRMPSLPRLPKRLPHHRLLLRHPHRNNQHHQRHPNRHLFQISAFTPHFRISFVRGEGGITLTTSLSTLLKTPNHLGATKQLTAPSTRYVDTACATTVTTNPV